MNHQNLRKLVLAALLAALCYVGTVILQIPSPMNGFVNLGDCFVLLSGWTLGPAWGFAAGGLGSALADLLTGYAHYAPGTFLIKGGMALLAAVLSRAGRGPVWLRRGISGLAAETLMVAGYFGYASLLLGKGLAAAASIPGNLVQAVFGLTAGLALQHLLRPERLILPAAHG